MRLPHNAPIYDGAEERRLLIQRCTRCGHVPSFPRIACPRCLGELEWQQAVGTGKVVSFTIVHRPDRSLSDRIPIVLAVIALEEGAETIASIVGERRLELQIGDTVEVAVEETWSELPQFVRRPGS
jgi:uncharacterized OB-fold protein